MQSSVLALAGMMPPRYINSALTGNGLSGMLMSLCRLIVLYVLPTNYEDPKLTEKNLLYGSIFYFSIAAAFMLLCISCILYLERLPFTRYHIMKSATPSRAKIRSKGKKHTEPLPKKPRHQEILDSDALKEQGTPAYIRERIDKMYNPSPKKYSLRKAVAKMGYSANQHKQFIFSNPKRSATGLDDFSFSDLSNKSSGSHKIVQRKKLGRPASMDVLAEKKGVNFALSVPESDDENDEELNTPSLYDIFGKNWQLAAIIFVVYFQTNITFPGVALKTNLTFTDPSWFVLIIVTCFHIFDLGGRHYANYVKEDRKSILTSFMLLRFVFFFTFIMIATHSTYLHVLFENDYFKILNICAFAFSHGWITSIAMMLAPTLVEDHEKETTSYIMSVMTVSGIFVGCLVANFYIKNII